MWRLLTEEPQLLEPRHIVHFSQNYEKEFENKYFKVDRVNPMVFGRHFVVNSDTHFDLPLYNDFGDVPSGGLEPYKNFQTLYEVLIGLAPANAILYPRIPSTDWYNKLEAPGGNPDPSSELLRYLGGYKGRDSPLYEPHLRAMLVYGQEPLTLRLFADSPKAEKIRLNLIINRCRIVEVKAPTPQEQAHAREIIHYSLVSGGQWGASSAAEQVYGGY